METLLKIDYIISDFLSKLVPHNAFFDTFFSFLSLEGNWVIVWAIVVGILIFTEIRQDKRIIVYVVMGMLATWVITHSIIKPIIQRSRPWVAKKLEISTCPRDFSFPSAHAAGAFAGATLISAFDKKRRPLYFFAAFLIAYSRIYLLCHYFLDTVAGGLIGTLISYVTLKIKIGKAGLKQI